MKHQGYLNRALASRDRRYATIFGKLGYDVGAMSTQSGSDLKPIPEDWRALNAADTKALALALTGEEFSTKADAVAAIELEIESRKASV
jgi:hypothetical protein